jgi:hypothetical protein
MHGDDNDNTGDVSKTLVRRFGSSTRKTYDDDRKVVPALKHAVRKWAFHAMTHQGFPAEPEVPSSEFVGTSSSSESFVKKLLIDVKKSIDGEDERKCVCDWVTLRWVEKRS